MSSLPSSLRLNSAQLRAVRSRLQLLIRDAGQTDLSPVAPHPHTPFWHLEPTPLVIEQGEWSVIEAACVQRARMVNAFLVDAYKDQQLLHNKIIPPELILGDPYYRRPCLHLEPHRDSPAAIIRFDLVKTPEGWMFSDTRVNTPIGMSYAVQNRRFLTQEATEVYNRLPDYHSIIHFPLKLLDTLHSVGPRAEGENSIVVLTAGPRDPFYSEHSFLARKMGLPLAQGDDLLVLDNRVYFKTIAGLEPVDVIYRRLNDAHIDPVVFSTDRETAGVPGLLQCIRHGTVAVANAIGSGLAENRTLDAYCSRLMRFYLGEKPLLPCIPTYTCGDVDQLDYILDSYQDMRIRPVHDPRQGATLPEPLPFLVGPSGLAPEVARDPFGYVAQRAVTHQKLDPDTSHSPNFTFSAFALVQNKRVTVLPGGLVHLGSGDPPRDRIGVTADAVVLQGSSSASIPDLEEHHTAAPLRVLGSRSAESLLWLGRYLERSEATARMLQIFDDVALEEVPARERHRWVPIWRGLFEATGHENAIAPVKNQAALPVEQLWRMTLDAQHPSSIISSVSYAAENGRQLRDYVSPESWAILSRLHARMVVLRRPDSGTSNESPLQIGAELRRKNAQAAIQSVTNEVNAFLGTAERTMLQDAGWHFLRSGIFLERAIMTCSALRHVLVFLAEEFKTPHQRLFHRENPELSALLRMLGSQDTYRRVFQTRTLPRYVATLFLQHAEAPRSIFHNLLQIRDCLRSVESELSNEDTPAIDVVTETLDFLSALRMDRYFHITDPAEEDESHQELDTALNELLDRLWSLQVHLSDHYFSHQARLPQAVQPELGFES